MRGRSSIRMECNLGRRWNMNMDQDCYKLRYAQTSLDALAVVISVLGTCRSTHTYCASTEGHSTALTVPSNGSTRRLGWLGWCCTGDKRRGNGFGCCWLDGGGRIASAIPDWWSRNGIGGGHHSIGRVDIERHSGLLASVGPWEGNERCGRWGDSATTGYSELSTFRINY